MERREGERERERGGQPGRENEVGEKAKDIPTYH